MSLTPLRKNQGEKMELKFKIERKKTNFRSISGKIYRKRNASILNLWYFLFFSIYLKSLTELSRELKDVSQEIEYARARTFKKYEINKYCILSKKPLQDTSSDICSIPNPASVSGIHVRFGRNKLVIPGWSNHKNLIQNQQPRG